MSTTRQNYLISLLISQIAFGYILQNLLTDWLSKSRVLFNVSITDAALLAYALCLCSSQRKFTLMQI